MQESSLIAPECDNAIRQPSAMAKTMPFSCDRSKKKAESEGVYCGRTRIPHIA